MLSSDFQNLNISNDENSLQKFIEEEAKYGPVNSECQNGQNDEIALNQAKILNVIKRFYGDPSAYDPNPSAAKSKSKKSQLQNYS